MNLARCFFDETAYDIYLYGDVPVGTEDEAAEFILPAESVKTCVHLDEAVFSQLPQVDALSTVPTAQALRAIQGKSSSPVVFILGLIVVAGIGFLAWKFLKPAPPPPPPSPVEIAHVSKPTGPPPDPLATYKQALHSPIPSAVFQSIVKQIHRLYGISGWTISAIDPSLTQLSVTLVPGNPTITAVPFGMACCMFDKVL